jgi:heat shock protein HslJ
MRPIPPLAFLVLAACASGETPPPVEPVSAPISAPEDAVWLLDAINGTPVSGDTRLVLADGAFNGKGPCNPIRGKYERSGESFSTVGVIVSQRSCPLQAEEDELLDGLLTARSAAVANRTLTLRSPNGPTLIFRPESG